MSFVAKLKPKFALDDRAVLIVRKVRTPQGRTVANGDLSNGNVWNETGQQKINRFEQSK